MLYLLEFFHRPAADSVGRAYGNLSHSKERPDESGCTAQVRVIFASLLATALVMVFLFLRPETVVGLQVELDPAANSIGLSGFNPGDPVSIHGRVKLEGGFEDLEQVTFSVVQLPAPAGFIQSPGFIPFTGGNAVVLPTVPGTADLTNLLPTTGGAPQGTLNAQVMFTEVVLVRITNGYGYQGTGDTGGVIEFWITYTPPNILGDYRASLSVKPGGQPERSLGTDFSILGPLTIAALESLYLASTGGAQAGDLSILQASLGATFVKDMVSLEVCGALLPEVLTMIKAENVHPSLRTKWGVDPQAKFILVFLVPDNTLPGQYTLTIKGVDVSGQTFTTFPNLCDTQTSPVVGVATSPSASLGTSPVVEVADTRTSFIFNLMPRLTFVTPILTVPCGR